MKGVVATRDQLRQSVEWSVAGGDLKDALRGEAKSAQSGNERQKERLELRVERNVQKGALGGVFGITVSGHEALAGGLGLLFEKRSPLAAGSVASDPFFFGLPRINGVILRYNPFHAFNGVADLFVCHPEYSADLFRRRVGSGDDLFLPRHIYTQSNAPESIVWHSRSTYWGIEPDYKFSCWIA
jgi:hypothetical protein